MKGLVCFFLLASLWGVLPAYAQRECSMQLSPAALDYGLRSRGGFQASSAGAELSFGPRRVNVQVQCNESQTIGLRFDAPAADAQHYRFGPGALQVKVVSVQLDGQAVNWLSELDGAHNAALLRPGDRIRPWVNGKTPLGQRLQLELEIEPRINQQSARVRDVSVFQSSGRFLLE